MQNFFGIAPQYLGNVEKGTYSLSIEKIILLSEKTGISTDHILLGIESTTKDKIANLLYKYDETQLKVMFEIVQNIESLINNK